MARQVIVEVIGETTKFTSATNGAITQSGKLARGFDGIKQGAAQGFGLAGALGVVGLTATAIGGVVNVVGDAIQAGSDLAETQSKVGVVFGSSSKDVLAWGQNASTALGMSTNQALSAAAQYGNLFVSLGITGQKATDMSKSMVGLAADMASFNNASPEETLAAIQSGLVGETEPLRKFGVNLNDAALREQALSMGLIKTTKDVLPASVKAQAAYALILKQSGTAQGDFARTSDGLANQQRISSAKMADAMAKLGAAIAPIAAKIVPMLADALIGVISVMSNVWKAIQPVISTIATALMPVFKTIAAFIANPVIPVLNEVGKVVFPILSRAGALMGQQIGATFNTIKTVITVAANVIGTVLRVMGTVFSTVFAVVRTVVTTAQSVIATVGAAIGRVFTTIYTTVSTVITNIRTAINNIVSFFTSVPGRIAGALGRLFDPLWQGFRGAINAVIRGWNSLKFSIPSVDLGPLGTFGGFSVGTPNIPTLHTGGIVPGSPGSNVLAILQAGEEVRSRTATGGGDNHFHFHGPFYGGPSGLDELAEAVAGRLRIQGATRG